MKTMTIKEFIEKAIEGGWSMEEVPTPQKPEVTQSFEKTLLDPKAWEAVGKVEWRVEMDCGGGIECWCDSHYDEEETIFQAKYKMHQMIDHLIDGGTIETYLETL